ncbi:anosmin-1 [Bacillus rossius redtenbacheri]|uniref:anosmin-1 n=1 Tax=Bacillus rossius redtenbacheri TaxID=93214 RepID=UPI002FDD404A
MKAEVQCVSECEAQPVTKPGRCPAAADVSVFAAACLSACSGDGACPGTLKCCSHRCGATCQEARGLDTAPGLPETPANLTVEEARRGRHVTVHWTAPARAGVMYLLEERHHVGREFSPQRLGPWLPANRTAFPHTSLRRQVRPGRWYLFRVAAVGAAGTRGFSRPSAPFMLSRDPKPPAAPTDLAASSLRAADGSCTGVLTWRAPVSDLPVQRYRVYWSRRLASAASTPTSVLQYKDHVSRHYTKYLLRNLLPDSQYFLQVQAFAQFGPDRLKGELAGVVLNTTDSNQLR